MRASAATALLRRYGTVLRHAWRARKEMDGPGRTRAEAAFLPAALSLQESPVSPAPRVAQWLLIAFAGLAVAWSFIGSVDVVAVAAGRVVPSDRSKIVQPLEPATVKRIHVSDGQEVRAGELLIELDATAPEADVANAKADLLSARLEERRLEALLEAIDGRPPAFAPSGADAARLGHERRLLQGQLADFHTKLQRLEAELDRRRAEVRSIEETVAKLAQTAPMAANRAKDYRELMERNFVSRHGYLEREQARIEQEADLATQSARLTEARARLREAEHQRSGHVAESRRQALDRLHEVRRRASSLDNELAKVEQRSKLMRLTAPVEGRVQQLAVHTIGGVVTPAQPLLTLVPRDNPVEVEAWVENKDIGFVQAGQAAEVKLETFPFTRYGTIPASVVSVSGDAVSDEKRGLVYHARVKLHRASIRVDQKEVRLSPGMAASVEVKTGTRRIAEYFLSPLLQYRDESLRER